MAESDDYPELVPESSTVSIAAHNAFDRDVLDAEKGFHHIADPSTLWPDYCNPSYKMPDRIDVKVVTEAETYYFPVVIVKEAAKKMYLGGYRNKLSGRQYHHASSQTPTDHKKPTKDFSNVRSRETQTYEVRSLSVQPCRESGTQMERIDLRIDNRRDVIIYPKSYFTSDELLAKKKMSTIEIQRCWRGRMARSLANRLRQRNIDFDRRVVQDRESEVVALREQRVKDMARRTHPKSNTDFVVLYNELDSWRRDELQKIKTTLADPEQRKDAMADLLLHETKALRGLQQLKRAAQKELQKERTQNMLERMAMPHLWQLSKGEAAKVFTPETQRAKELLDLFNALNAPLLSTDQRLDVLLNVKWTVQEMVSPLTQEIVELVDREADLLNRGRAVKSMESLRLRIHHLFLRFLENPEYNPRAAEFMVEK